MNEENPNFCIGCGNLHGSVNKLIRCLEHTIIRLRDEAMRQGAEVVSLREFQDRIKKPVQEFHRIPTTPGGHFDRNRKKR